MWSRTEQNEPRVLGLVSRKHNLHPLLQRLNACKKFLEFPIPHFNLWLKSQLLFSKTAFANVTQSCFIATYKMLTLDLSIEIYTLNYPSFLIFFSFLTFCDFSILLVALQSSKHLFSESFLFSFFF